jgi:hypothetical protein
MTRFSTLVRERFTFDGTFRVFSDMALEVMWSGVDENGITVDSKLVYANRRKRREVNGRFRQRQTMKRPQKKNGNSNCAGFWKWINFLELKSEFDENVIDQCQMICWMKSSMTTDELWRDGYCKQDNHVKSRQIWISKSTLQSHCLNHHQMFCGQCGNEV